MAGTGLPPFVISVKGAFRRESSIDQGAGVGGVAHAADDLPPERPQIAGGHRRLQPKLRPSGFEIGRRFGRHRLGHVVPLQGLEVVTRPGTDGAEETILVDNRAFARSPAQLPVAIALDAGGGLTPVRTRGGVVVGRLAQGSREVGGGGSNRPFDLPGQGSLDRIQSLAHQVLSRLPAGLKFVFVALTA